MNVSMETKADRKDSFQIVTGQETICRRAQLSLVCCLVVLLLIGMFPQPTDAYSFLTHEDLVDVAWHGSIRPALLARFPKTTAAQLREALATIPGVTVRDLPGSGSQPRCGIVTFTHEAHAAGAIVETMREQRINVRVTPLGSTRIDMEQRGLTALVRASVHYYNTEEEIARFAEAVAAM